VRKYVFLGAGIGAGVAAASLGNRAIGRYIAVQKLCDRYAGQVFRAELLRSMTTSYAASATRARDAAWLVFKLVDEYPRLTLHGQWYKEAIDDGTVKLYDGVTSAVYQLQKVKDDWQLESLDGGRAYVIALDDDRSRTYHEAFLDFLDEGAESSN
jgi:hypothetical protein